MSSLHVKSSIVRDNYSACPIHTLLHSFSAPAQEAIVYEAKAFAMNPRVPNVYMGDPNAALNKAWEDLYDSSF